MRRSHKSIAAACLYGALLLPAVVAGAEPPRPFVSGSLQHIIDTHAGKPFILGFWSLSCSHCREELTLLGHMLRKYPRLPVVLVSTDSPDDGAAIGAALKGHSLEGRESWVFADPDSDRLRYQVDRRWYGELPRTYLYEKDGSATAYSGNVDAPRLEDWMRTRLERN